MAAKEKVPAWRQEPFQKQITRAQGVQGKLLEDVQVTRVIKGAKGSPELEQDARWFPDHRKLAHHLNFGVVHDFTLQIGRGGGESRRPASRAVPEGPASYWRAEKPPNEKLVRPASASPGVQFGQQITREQDVNGKLLEDNAMCRFLFGTTNAGPEYYEAAHDSMARPLHASHRKRLGVGNHRFRSQVGRLPLSRNGARASAESSHPSYWEPGCGYVETMGVRLEKQPNFERQLGRVPLHLAGMRGAPGRPDLESGGNRPMSAMATLRKPSGNPFMGKTPQHVQGKMPRGNLPVRHVQTPSMDKQLSRDAWISKPLRA